MSSWTVTSGEVEVLRIPRPEPIRSSYDGHVEVPERPGLATAFDSAAVEEFRL